MRLPLAATTFLLALAMTTPTAAATPRTALVIHAGAGIMSRDDGQAMLDAGASLLQIYTGFIYAGPALVNDLNRIALRRAEEE